jgi:hypothetical protein
MRRSQSFFDVLRSAAAVAAALVLVAGGAAAQPPSEGPVTLQFTVPVPVEKTNTTGGMYAYDISWVDQNTQTYYLGDRSNAAADVVDAASGTFIKQITAKPPFAGVATTCASPNLNNCSGPNGVVTGLVDGQNCLFVSDFKSRVVSFVVPAGTQVTDLSTGGTFRTDEMAFDPKDHLLLAVNNADSPPFATLISVASTCKLHIVKKLPFSFAAGAEQPVWDPTTSLFYMSIPQTSPGGPQNGELISILPKSPFTIVQFPVDFCGPNGLALNRRTGELLMGCGTVFDTAGNPWDPTKNVTATPYQVVINAKGIVQAYVPGIGGSDEVVYNANDNHFYTGSNGSPYAPSVVVSGGTAVSQGAAILGVIDGSSLGLDQQVPTFNVPAVKGVHPGGAGHSVAANDTNGWVFVPAPANNALPGCLKGCIQIFGRSNPDTD